MLSRQFHHGEFKLEEETRIYLAKLALSWAEHSKAGRAFFGAFAFLFAAMMAVLLLACSNIGNSAIGEGGRAATGDRSAHAHRRGACTHRSPVADRRHAAGGSQPPRLG